MWRTTGIDFRSCTFADDTTIFASSKSLRDQYKNVNSDIAALSNWFRANKLALNVNKSNYVLFRPSGILNIYDGNMLNIGPDKIEKKSRCKFLGIIIDDLLRWNHHTDYITLKLSRSLYIYIYILKPVKHILPLKLLKSLYCAMVHPYITYGIIFWGTTYQCHLNSITILQKKAIRCIHKAYYNAHTEPLFYRSNILKLEDIYKCELSKFMFDCINSLLPTRLLDYFTINANVHTHYTRQIHILHVTPTYGSISEKSVTHKGPKIWSEIPQIIRLHTNKDRFIKLLKWIT